MVIGVGGSEQGLQPTGYRSPTFRTGDNPLTLSDALVKCVAWRFHFECCHCLHAESSRTWLRHHWTALTLAVKVFKCIASVEEWLMNVTDCCFIIIIIRWHARRAYSRFHDASPGRTIRRSPQCRVKSKVERFEISLSIVRS